MALMRDWGESAGFPAIATVKKAVASPSANSVGAGSEYKVEFFSELVRARVLRAVRIVGVAALVSLGALAGSQSTGPAKAAAQSAGVLQTTANRPVVSMRVIRRDVRSGSSVAVRGRARSTAERFVRIEVRSRGGSWRRIGAARIRAHGLFKQSWTVRRPGRYEARARIIAPKALRITGKARTYDVYRAAHASWYGPGFYGGRTACGQRLTAAMVGVAHKSLPCGTRVTFRYGGREVIARVIDRGPFIAGREWDLTGATKRRLGFPSTGMVLSTR